MPGKPGRPVGSTNKANANARAAIARLIERNFERLESWLDEIYRQDGPQASWKCLMDVVEYHIPKLNRTEHVGDDGGPIEHSHKLSQATQRVLGALTGKKGDSE